MLSFYATIAKLDRARRVVVGYASTEALDQQGEIVRLEALEAALPDYMRFANIREMHQPSAVGIAEEAQVDAKGLWLSARVVDDRAWAKVEEGVYKGFSIGGRITARDPQDRRVVTGVDLTEISLVDRPANPEAVFAVMKRAAGTLRPEPQGLWDCSVAGHRHATKAEAATCMEQQMSMNPAEPGAFAAEPGLAKRSYTAQERAALAADGEALPDGSFPIRDRADLADAIRDWRRSKDPARAKAHIIARADALGASDMLPEAWRRTPRPHPEAVAKGVHILACLAQLLDEIEWLQQTAGENGQALAPGLAAWLADGIPLLRAVVADEAEAQIVPEDVAPLGDAVAPLVVEKAAAGRAWPLALAAALRHAGRAAGLATQLEKIGARNSRADRARIQRIHDQAVELGAHCAGGTETRDQGDAGLTKRVVERTDALEKIAAQLAPLAGAVDELKKRLAVVEATPLPPRAVLGAVALSKEEDGGASERAGLAARLMLLPPGPARAGEILRHAYYSPDAARR